MNFEASGAVPLAHEAHWSFTNGAEKMTLRKLILGTVAALMLAISPAMAEPPPSPERA